MSKKKKKVVQVEQVQDQTQEQTEVVKTFDEYAAIELVKLKYSVPEGVKVVFVTEDKQVFYNRNTAFKHSSDNGIKLFSIKWD